MLLFFGRKNGRLPPSRTVPAPPQTECATETLVTGKWMQGWELPPGEVAYEAPRPLGSLR